jgi:transcriptional regulator NrdR family protein
MAVSTMQPKAIDIVKRSGKRPSERFDAEKLHASIRAACLSVRSPDGEADTTALAVTDLVIVWCATKPEVTSHDLRRVASRHLEKFHPEAAYLYEQHRTII